MRRIETLSLGRKWARWAGSLPDPELPALAMLMRPEGAAGWCRRVLEAGNDMAGSVLEQVEILRYRPGRRCMLRLHFHGPYRKRLYVKIYRGHRAERIGGILEELHRQGPWFNLSLPILLATEPDDGAVVLGELPGPSLEERLEQDAGNLKESETIGRALIQFHSLSLSVARRWTVEDERVLLENHRSRLGSEPNLGATRIDSLFRRWEAESTFLESSPSGLLHRDLHPQQILLDRHCVGLTDLDNLATGPVAFDLGNLLAHFDLYRLFLGRDPRALEEVGRRILATYGSIRSIPPVAIRVARCGTLMRLAGIYLQFPDLAWLVPGLVRQAEVTLRRKAPA